LGSSILTISTIMVIQCHYQETGISSFLSTHLYTIIMFLLLGEFCGELHRYFAKAAQREKFLRAESLERLRFLDEENYLLRECKDELECSLAVAYAETSTLDMEIRNLYQSMGDDYFDGLLDIFFRKFHTSAAAVYLINDQGVFCRKSMIGHEKTFPSKLFSQESGLLRKILETGKTVTLPQYWSPDYSQLDDFLLGLPFIGESGNVSGVVLIHTMPFELMDRRTISSIDLMCRWISHLINIRESNGHFRPAGSSGIQKVFPREQFTTSLQLARDTFEQFELPSSFLLIFTDGVASSQLGVENIILANVRTTDTAIHLQSDSPHLLVFMPLTGARGAELARERVLGYCVKKESVITGKFHAEIFVIDRNGLAQSTFDGIQNALRIPL